MRSSLTTVRSLGVLAVLLTMTSCGGMVPTVTKSATEGAPSRITIRPDDYHVPYAGKAGDGRLFFLSDELFDGGSTTREAKQFVALFLWKTDGTFDSVEVTDVKRRADLPTQQAGHTADDAALHTYLDQLGDYELEPIAVAPFSHTVDGVVFGFVPQEYDGMWSVNIQPGDFIAYYAPWDGYEYDT
jgi:hypothetical protein